MENGRERALEALGEYRREEGEAARCLLEGVRRLEAQGEERRRAVLVERAVGEWGMEWDAAEEVYVIAEEEGVDPAFAFQLVRCGVGVSSGPEQPGQPTQAPTELEPDVTPLWIAGTEPPPPDEVRLERRLRASFRRLRGLLQERATPEEALLAFVDEPDVDASGD